MYETVHAYMYVSKMNRNDSTIKQNELLTHRISWMNSKTLCWVKEGGHKKIHIEGNYVKLYKS